MKFPSKEIVERVRRQYPVGCRVELCRMNDVQAPPIGTKGTVYGVDDTASVLVHWDNGSGLNVVYGEDYAVKICPRCGKPFSGIPALSRADNKAFICPDCGTREALESIGVEPDEQEQILETIHRSMNE